MGRTCLKNPHGREAVFAGALRPLDSARVASPGQCVRNAAHEDS